jgi:hypothetical protein
MVNPNKWLIPLLSLQQKRNHANWDCGFSKRLPAIAEVPNPDGVGGSANNIIETNRLWTENAGVNYEYGRWKPIKQHENSGLNREALLQLRRVEDVNKIVLEQVWAFRCMANIKLI